MLSQRIFLGRCPVSLTGGYISSCARVYDVVYVCTGRSTLESLLRFLVEEKGTLANETFLSLMAGFSLNGLSCI